jgi:hypothetical protein
VIGRQHRVVVASALALALMLAACGSGTTTANPPSTTGPSDASGGSNAPISKTIGTGVTDKTIKIGVALVDFECIAPYIQTTRVDEYKVYDAFIADINARGGVAGASSCPCTARSARSFPRPRSRCARSSPRTTRCSRCSATSSTSPARHSPASPSSTTAC